MKLKTFKIVSNLSINNELIKNINLILEILDNKEKRYLNLAIPFLNIIKLTSDNFEKYLFNINNKNTRNINKSIYLKLIKFIKLFFFENPTINTKNIYKKENDTVLISHLVNKEQLVNFDKIYYSNFSNKLLKTKEFTIIYINHLDEYSKNLRSNNKKYNTIILPKRNKFLKEIKYIYDLYKHSYYYKKQFKIITNKNNNIISYLSNVKNYTDAISSLRIAEQIDTIINDKKHIKYLVAPFEGKSWERLVFNRIRKYERVITYGYFTSPLFKNTISPYLYNYDEYLPSKIISPIRINKILYKLKDSKLRNKILSIHSSQKNSYTKEKNNKVFNLNKIKILLIPEGTYFETNLMYQFAQEILSNFKNINLVFRLHPLLKNKYKTKINIKNLEFSNNTLDEDIKLCNFIFYRGSGSVFRAIGKEIIPVYINYKDTINIDPYFPINSKFTINSEYQFKILLKNIKKNNTMVNKYLYLIDKFFNLSIDNNKIKKIFINHEK